MGYCFNCLDEFVFMAVPKPLLTEFGINYRLESCVEHFNSPAVLPSCCEADCLEALFMDEITVPMAFKTKEISEAFWRCKGMFLFNFSPSMAWTRTSLNRWSREVMAR